jgi:hypothetical protein
MINIKLNRKYTQNDIWGKYLIYHLSNHPDIKTEILKNPLPILIGGRRGINNLTPFIYNDVVFIVDDWDHASPTCYLLNNPNIPKFYLNNNVCILKIQYCHSEINNYDKIYKQCNIKILPFTMFSEHSFKLANFKYNINYNHKYNYIITGRPWRHRLSWIRNAQQLEYGSNNLNTKYNFDNDSISPDIRFYEMLKESRWGLILKGKGCGGKNRREVEFSSLGMPLALNYIPNYPFHFVPNKDFLLLESPEDLIKLKDIDPEPFAKRSEYIYYEYFSPEFGIYNSFKKAYEEFKYYSMLDNTLSSAIDYTSIEEDYNIIEIIPHIGYNLGLLNNGDYISLQYKKGSWKSWGRKKRKQVNPDNTNGRGGNRARLGIFCINNNSKTLIQIIPEYTHKNPFIFNVPENNMNLYIDICDQEHLAEGSVSYFIKVNKKS